MQIAIIENNAVVRIGHYKNLFPNTAFPSTGPSDSFLTENNAKKVTVYIPFDRHSEKLVPVEPYIEDNQVFAVRVEALSDDEVAAHINGQWASVRRQRDQMLASTDWRVLPDVPGDQTGWLEYRQALRDITIQDDPFNVVWPQDPNYQEPPQMTSQEPEQVITETVVTTDDGPMTVEVQQETATATTTTAISD